ncbi:MFS transporter [Cytobacillus purgationiresistens]|uniref:ACS family hexuronate transporter-like MFS transporter n=1 Tax=Cytobacillus purgationiresistens TaxID=863449 RepID=A0ABU0AMW4_9BACI|nr:MFS transporter [Cytobacillus purgationiresistens]MDQ0272370.1 ACS family hexuronate transporter-like MFS transporter [Cytobacillus purgationiresistens]
MKKLKTFATKYRYRIIFLSFLAALINYADRAAISIASPAIIEDLQFSAVEWGFILSAFYFTYAPFAFIGGILNDKIGARNTYGLSMIVWSTFVGVTATAWNFGSMMIIRLLFGVGEGPQAPTATKLVSNWFPKSESARALSLSQLGTTIGPIIAAPLVVWLTVNWGWRLSFVILGLLGIIWAIVWFLVAKDKPEQHKKVNQQEVDYIRVSVGDDKTPNRSTVVDTGRGMWSYIKTPYVVSICICYFAYSWVLFLVLSWYPTYLVNSRGVSMQQMGSLATWPWIGASIGLIGGAFLADYFVKRSRTGDLVSGRKWIIVVTMICTGLTFGPSAFVASPNVAVTLVTVSMMLLLASWQYQSLIIAVIPDRLLGSVSGFIQFISTLAGIIAPIATGYLVEYTGSYNYAFYLGSFLAAFGAILVSIFVNKSSISKSTSIETNDVTAN